MKTLRHVALCFDDEARLVDELVDVIDADRRNGSAVLVCLPETIAQPLRARTDDDGITFLPVDDRYARPITAMKALWDFTHRALASGATRVHSIGEIRFDGTAADVDWHWYERAVNEVFADLPLDATCLFDLNRVGRDTLACAHATHPEVSGADDGVEPVPAESLVPRHVSVPERGPDVHLVGTTDLRAARRSLDQLGAHDSALMDRARLIVSELVTNALLHGGGAADLHCWNTDEGIVLQVADDGAGVDDPIASLRPPSLPERGAGLWICHVESTRLHVARRSTGGTVVTALVN